MAGRLITIEGLDGTGKSTLAAGLAEALAGRGVEAEVMREPGGVEASERLRDLVKDPALEVGPQAEALIYAAARAQLVAERLRPLLGQGRWVILDRFVDSSLAYQGAGRGLGIENVAAINEMATQGIIADRTLLLQLEPGERAGRLDGRGEQADRLEAAGDGFFEAVEAGYRELAAAEPGRIRVLDASLAPGELVGAAIVAVEDLLP
jgi:dTMP kinase